MHGRHTIHEAHFGTTTSLTTISLAFKETKQTEMKMVNEYTRYRVPDDKRAAFLSDYTKAGEHLRASSACLGYELGQCEEEPDCFILRIIWQSTAAHLEGFRASEEFRRFLPLIKAYIPFIEEMRHYTPTSTCWNRT